MADPRQGRAGQSGFSPRLGARDPRLRANQAGAVSDADLDQQTIARDAAGRQRFSAWDDIPPLKPTATLSEVIARMNLLQARGKGIK